jgi:putative sigma-54 modulation protein
MNVYKLVGRNVEVTDALRDYVANRLRKLERFSSQIVDAKVVLHVKAASNIDRRNRVEMQLNVPNGIIRAEEASADMYQAIDAAANVLERQLKKFRGKFVDRMQRQAEVGLPEAENEDDGEEFTPEIVRTKRFEMRPMAPEDAAAQLEALGHDFYVFTNSQSSMVNVIYKRRDGNYGLIEPRA